MPSAAQRQRVKTTLAKPRPLLTCEHADEWLPPQKSLSTAVAKSMVLSARSKDPIGQKHEWYASVGKFEDCSPSATNRSTYNATRCAGSNAPPLSAWNVPLDSVREVHPDYGCRMPMRSAHGLFDASHQMRNATSTAREASKTDDVPFKTHHNGMLRSKWMSLIGFQSIGQKEDVYESSSSASWGKQRLDRVSNGKRTLCSTDLLCGLVVVLVVTGSVAWLVAAFAFGGRADDGSSGTISQTASALHDGSSGYVPNAGSTGPRSIPPSAPSSLLPHSPSSPIQIPRPLPQSPPNMGNSGASTQQGQPNTEPQSAQGEDGRQSESPAATPPASPNRTSIAGTEATYNDTVVLNPTSGDQSAVGYTGIPLDVTIVDKPPPLPPRPPPPPPGGDLNGQPLNVTISVGTQSGGSGGSGGSGSNPNALSESATPPAHPPPTSPPVTPNPHSPPRPPPVSPSPSTPPFAPPPPPPVPSPPPSPPPPSPPSAPPRPPGTRSPPPSPPFPPPPPPPPPPIPSPPPLPPPPPPPSPPPPPPPSPSPPQTPLPSAPPGSPTPHTPPPPPVPPSPPPSWPPQTIAESAFQRYALMQLYTKTSGDTWTRNDRWGTADPCGGEIDANGDVSGPWYGLQCTQGRVSSMHLNSNHMVGSIPDSIGMLEYIRDLDLSRNHITGTIPSTLGNLKHLEQSLSIYDTQISGTIPRELGRLSRLKDGVNLFWNKLSGTVPAEISHLHPKECALSIQGMATNSFTCPLPSGLEHCRVDCHTECDDSVAGADCGSGGYDGMVEAEDAFGHLFAFSDSPPPSPSPYPPPPPPPSPPPPPPPPSPPSPPPPPPPSPPPPSPEPRPPPPTPPPPTPPPPTPPLPLAPGVLPGQESALANGANSDESSLTTGEATAVGTTTALVATTGGVALLALAVCFRRRRVKMRKQNSLPLLPSRQAQPVIDVDDTHVNASPRSNGTNSSSERLRMTASLPDIMRRRVLSMWNPGFGVESPRVANTSLVHTTAQIVPPRWDTVPVHSQSAPPGSISRTPDDAYLGDLQPTTVIGAGALGAQSSVGALQLSSGVPALTMQLPEAGHELDGLFSHRSHAESVTDSVYEMESVTARRANESDAPAASSLQAMGQSVMNAIDAAATFASTLVEPEPERPSQQDAASDSNDEGDSEHTASVVSDGGNQSPRSGEDSESHDEEDSHEDPADALGSQRGGCTVDDIDIDDEHTAGDDDADSYVSQSTLGAPAACSGSVALSSATLCGARLSRQHSCASNSAESRISMHSLATSTDTQIPVAARMPPPSPFTMQPNRYPQSSASRRTHRGSAGLSDSPAGSNHNSPRILGSTSSRRSSPRSASEATVTRV